MYAVIFRAQTKHHDPQYGKIAMKLRDLAMHDYGCIDFVAVTEGQQEVAISYWEDIESIQRWKKNSLHLDAQKCGRQEWYKSYTIEVVEVKKQYTFPNGG